MKLFQIYAVNRRSAAPVGEVIWVLARTEEQVRKVVRSVPEPYTDDAITEVTSGASMSDVDFVLPEQSSALREKLVRFCGVAALKRFQTVTYCLTEGQLVALLEFCDDHHIDFEQPEAVDAEPRGVPGAYEEDE